MSSKRSVNSATNRTRIRSTTVVCVRRGSGKAGQNLVTVKPADAFSLFARFEAKLEQYHGNLGRAAVELAKDWRTDKVLRHLEALLLVSDVTQTYLISGAGDVIEPDGGVAAIGSGGSYALAAAKALVENTELPARKIAEEAMKIAGKICIYTNDTFTIEELAGAGKQ